MLGLDVLKTIAAQNRPLYGETVAIVYMTIQYVHTSQLEQSIHIAMKYIWEKVCTLPNSSLEVWTDNPIRDSVPKGKKKMCQEQNESGSALPPLPM